MELYQVHTNGDARETGALMRDMAYRYAQDMAPYLHLTLNEVFDKIKKIPFRPDPPDAETLMRPRYTMRLQGFGGDCDDKAIALAAYLILKGGRAWTPNIRPRQFDWRFIAVRRADYDTLHHVFLQIYINGMWVSADPTYSFNALGRERETYIDRVII